jgi:hypothetical protein
MIAGKIASGEEQIEVTRCRVCKPSSWTKSSMVRGLCWPHATIVAVAVKPARFAAR